MNISKVTEQNQTEIGLSSQRNESQSQAFENISSYKTENMQTSQTSFFSSKNLEEGIIESSRDINCLLPPIKFKNEKSGYQWLSLYQPSRDRFSVLPAIQSTSAVSSPQLLKSSPTYQCLPEIASSPLIFGIDGVETSRAMNSSLRSSERYDLPASFKEFTTCSEETEAGRSWMGTLMSPSDLEKLGYNNQVRKQQSKTKTNKAYTISRRDEIPSEVIIDQELLTSDPENHFFIPRNQDEGKVCVTAEKLGIVKQDKPCQYQIPLIPSDLSMETRQKRSQNLTRFDRSSNPLTLDHDVKPKVLIRSRSGCWTCRIRHKSCPEEHPICSQCKRLSLTCDYSPTRPSYMTDPYLNKMKLAQIRIVTRAFKRGILKQRRNAQKLKTCLNN